ncbi:MAG TPA: sensor histidine kinase [Caulobacteraceae bacterium]|jgi:two-component sensor histidine kinase|nr:sensor histidine kinase [Caulobacteraceae bacterium]
MRTWAWGASRFQTIRFRLAGALMLAVAPVLILGAAESYDSFKRESAHQSTDLTAAAVHSTATAQARIESAEAVLETLKTDPAGGDCPVRLRNLVDRLNGYSAFARFDAAGRAVCASDGTRIIQDISGTSWFRRIADGEQQVLARAPAAGSQGSPEMFVAVRDVEADGAFRGVLIAELPLTDFAPAARDNTLPHDAEVAVTDESGSILSATDHKAFPAAGHTGWVGDAAREGSSLFYARDAAGRDRVFVGAPLAGDDVFVLISAPTEGAFSWARLNPVSSIGLPLLFFALAVLAVIAAAERVVVRWLEYLERIASIYAKGRFTVRPVQARNAPLEIRMLAITLDQMADAIDARDASLRDSIEHKDALMREIHHRVKNNLQVISSLLNMQQRSLTDPAARAAMSDTRQRITALALIYRALYQSADLRRVDVRQFLEELISQLVANDAGRGGQVVKTELTADALVIDPDKLAPLALWAVEAISNAQKHAFVARGGVLRVRFTVGPEVCTLEVEDDGPGPANTDDPARGLGRTLMTAFARQLRGDSDIVAAPDGGVLARLSFPTLDAGVPSDESATEEAPAAPLARGNPAAA